MLIMIFLISIWVFSTLFGIPSNVVSHEVWIEQVCPDALGPLHRCVSATSCITAFSDSYKHIPRCGPMKRGFCCPVIHSHSQPRCGIRHPQMLNQNRIYNANGERRKRNVLENIKYHKKQNLRINLEKRKKRDSHGGIGLNEIKKYKNSKEIIKRRYKRAEKYYCSSTNINYTNYDNDDHLQANSTQILNKSKLLNPDDIAKSVITKIPFRAKRNRKVEIPGISKNSSHIAATSEPDPLIPDYENSEQDLDYIAYDNNNFKTKNKESKQNTTPLISENSYTNNNEDIYLHGEEKNKVKSENIKTKHSDEISSNSGGKYGYPNTNKNDNLSPNSNTKYEVKLENSYSKLNARIPSNSGEKYQFRTENSNDEEKYRLQSENSDANNNGDIYPYKEENIKLKAKNTKQKKSEEIISNSKLKYSEDIPSNSEGKKQSNLKKSSRKINGSIPAKSKENHPTFEFRKHSIKASEESESDLPSFLRSRARTNPPNIQSRLSKSKNINNTVTSYPIIKASLREDLVILNYSTTSKVFETTTEIPLLSTSSNSVTIPPTGNIQIATERTTYAYTSDLEQQSNTKNGLQTEIKQELLKNNTAEQGTELAQNVQYRLHVNIKSQTGHKQEKQNNSTVAQEAEKSSSSNITVDQEGGNAENLQQQLLINGSSQSELKQETLNDSTAEEETEKASSNKTSDEEAGNAGNLQQQSRIDNTSQSTFIQEMLNNTTVTLVTEKILTGNKTAENTSKQEAEQETAEHEAATAESGFTVLTTTESVDTVSGSLMMEIISRQKQRNFSLDDKHAYIPFYQEEKRDIDPGMKKLYRKRLFRKGKYKISHLGDGARVLKANLNVSLTMSNETELNLSGQANNKTFKADQQKLFRSHNMKQDLLLHINRSHDIKMNSSVLIKKSRNQQDNAPTKKTNLDVNMFDFNLLTDEASVENDSISMGNNMQAATKEKSEDSLDSDEESKEITPIRKGTPEYTIGGKLEAMSWPWMVGIYSYPKMQFICGGSLIDYQHVLSAAHCFYQDDDDTEGYAVVIGQLDRAKTTIPSEHFFRVEKLYLHEKFTPECFCHDIALLRLRKIVGPEYTPICLPDKDTAGPGENGTVLGWGDTKYSKSEDSSTQRLQRLDDIILYPGNECRNIISRIAGKALPSNFGDYYICAGVPDGSKDACVGDSGGPLMHEDYDGFWSLIGVVSFGYKCGNPGTPGTYARVSYFIPWIMYHIDNKP